MTDIIKKIRFTSLTLLAALPFLFFAVSCEKELEVPSVENSKNLLSLYAIAQPGQKVSARIAWLEGEKKAAPDRYDNDLFTLWMRLVVGQQLNLPAEADLMKYYYENLLVKEAEVTLTPNGGTPVKMEYNPATKNFECDYIPRVADRLRIDVSAPGRNSDVTPYDTHIYSEVEIPSWTPEAKILDIGFLIRPLETVPGYPITQEVGSDSVAVFKIAINDNDGFRKFYRLKMTQSTFHRIPLNEKEDPFGWNGELLYAWNSVFTSSDPLLYEPTLGHPFGIWPAFQTDIFTNEAFRGGSYLLSVEQRMSSYFRPVVNGSSGVIYGRHEIELQPLTRELSEYLAVFYRLRISKKSYFSSPMAIPSNVVGGKGIFGAIGKPKIMRYWRADDRQFDIDLPDEE